MLYSLIIKSRDEHDARIEAANRGILLVATVRITDDEVRGTSNVPIQTLQAWLAEDLGRSAPFPNGALLYFAELNPEKTSAALLFAEASAV